MCYNVLSDKYATRQMYGYCPSWALDWEYRKKGILDEIRHYAADIISLQEVETDQFYNFFLPELKHEGYDGIFSPKSRAKTMSESDRKFVDGSVPMIRFVRPRGFADLQVGSRLSVGSANTREGSLHPCMVRPPDFRVRGINRGSAREEGSAQDAATGSPTWEASACHHRL